MAARKRKPLGEGSTYADAVMRSFDRISLVGAGDGSPRPQVHDPEDADDRDTDTDEVRYD